MKPAVQRVIDALATEGIVVVPREFAESTRTAADAAIAIGTTIAQIAKALVFLAGDEPILVLASGAAHTSRRHRATPRCVRSANQPGAC